MANKSCHMSSWFHARKSYNKMSNVCVTHSVDRARKPYCSQICSRCLNHLLLMKGLVEIVGKFLRAASRFIATEDARASHLQHTVSRCEVSTYRSCRKESVVG